VGGGISQLDANQEGKSNGGDRRGCVKRGANGGNGKEKGGFQRGAGILIGCGHHGTTWHREEERLTHKKERKGGGRKHSGITRPGLSDTKEAKVQAETEKKKPGRMREGKRGLSP